MDASENVNGQLFTLCFHVSQTAVLVRLNTEFEVGTGRALQDATDLPLTIVCDRRHSRNKGKFTQSY